MTLIKLVILFIMLSACNSRADVAITEAWVRANAPGQSVGAAYMTFKSPLDISLVSIEADAAGSVEIHSMSMSNGVMKMRMLDELVIKAGKPEKLAPGGFHLMLFDLKKSLKAGKSVTFKLSFKDKTNKISTQSVVLPIKEVN